MKRGFLSEYFEGVVAKRLSAVEANPDQSNQHEFNGVVPLKSLLGTERLQNCRTLFVWLGEENEGISEESTSTWYDAREKHPTRSEFRLYFVSNPVMDIASAGDLLIIAKRPNNELMVIVVQAGSTVENQMLWLFSIQSDVNTESFEYRDFDETHDAELDFTARFVLDELGIDIEDPEADKLDSLLEHFEHKFPSTVKFSEFARSTIPEVSPYDGPDAAIVAWMDREEKLFRRLERYIVAERLKKGFDNGNDVDGFIHFSLSVQNRRKSRTGHAFENHLEEIFDKLEIKYQRNVITEHRHKPDFLFPGGEEYHDKEFPADKLTMLGVKSTCKDRWRQVLSEAERIKKKHLITLEPGISENQTEQMKQSDLQLVLPKRLHETYSQGQREWLIDLDGFIDLIKSRDR